MNLTKLLTLFLGLLLVMPAAAQDPQLQPDDTWISVSGTVEAVTADAFTLKYDDGDKFITVEMDDGDRDADAYKLVKGDEVTVTGFIDDDLFETRTIEASTVYVENLGTTFYASSMDEEDVYIYSPTPFVMSITHVIGTVTDIGINQFIVDTGVRSVIVKVDALGYDPLDDEGYQKIEVGDRVSVTGEIDYDFFEGRVLEADSVVEFSPAS